MPFMVTNARLAEATKNPEILTPKEVKAIAAEVIRDRKYIRTMMQAKIVTLHAG